MLRKLLGAAAMAATAYAMVPAYAAHIHAGVGCSGENLAKAESGIDVAADGPGKFMAEREIARAQDALLSGKMGECAMHLGRAMRSESTAQASYQAAYPETMAQAPLMQTPAATTQQTWSQPQWRWEPMQGQQ
jgi:hypothetical protein